MKITKLMVISLLTCTATWVHADDGAQKSISEGGYETERTIKDNVLGISPQVGVIGFTDPATDDYTTRGVAGLGVDLNVVPFAFPNGKDGYLGVSTGAFYSHLGSASSNFFGNETGAGSSGGANALVIPADIKVGYNFTPSTRISVHGGGNVMYRSVAQSMRLDSKKGADSAWGINPNVGADFEYQISRILNFIARPDVTIVAGNSMFMGTVGLNITPSF